MASTFLPPSSAPTTPAELQAVDVAFARSPTRLSSESNPAVGGVRDVERADNFTSFQGGVEGGVMDNSASTLGERAVVLEPFLFAAAIKTSAQVTVQHRHHYPFGPSNGSHDGKGGQDVDWSK